MTPPKRSALSTIAPPAMLKAGASSTAVATGKCARRKAASLEQHHMASMRSMAQMERASLQDAQDAPPTQTLGLRIASNTAVERSRAPWRAAPPPLNARVSAQNTAVVQATAFLATAPTNRQDVRETCAAHGAVG